MKLKNNIIFQYSVITLLVITIVSVLLASILSRKITDYLILTHINIYPEVVQIILNNNPEAYSVFKMSPQKKADEEITTWLRELLEFGAVYRIKIWDKKGTILWSDQKEIIGKSFADNILFQSAIKGEVVYDVDIPDKSENLLEADRGQTLEIYTPVFEKGGIVGVFEFYEADAALHHQISLNIRIVWQLTVVSGICLYFLQFLIFYRSHKRQRKINEQLLKTEEVTIFALAYQAELRDMETGLHLDRTSLYTRFLADELAKIEKYREYMTSKYIEDLVKSAPLHDIGKVGIKDAILRKPGKLTEDEFNEMKRHCEYGVKVLEKAEKRLHFVSFLEIAIQLTRSHHEKWNGTGYPDGLEGEGIPLSARIMALADVYDALRSARVYKPAFSHEISRKILIDDKGTHFDPDVVDAFLAREKDFETISEKMMD